MAIQEIQDVVQCPTFGSDESMYDVGTVVEYLRGMYCIGAHFAYWSQSMQTWLDIGGDIIPHDERYDGIIATMRNRGETSNIDSLNALLRASYWCAVAGKLSYMSSLCRDGSRWRCMLLGCAAACIEAAQGWRDMWYDSGAYILIDKRDAWRMQLMDDVRPYFSSDARWHETQRAIIEKARRAYVSR